MPDDLRAQIDKALDDNPRLIGSTLDAARKEIIKTVLPVVEQAIQQAREKRVTTAAECLQRLAEKDAALAAIEAGLRAEFANGGTYEGHDIISAFGEFIEHHAKLESALAEKDAQIAALKQERDELLREGVKWIADRAKKDAQIAALQEALAGVRAIIKPWMEERSRATVSFPDWVEAVDKLLSVLRETPAPPQEPK